MRKGEGRGWREWEEKGRKVREGRREVWMLGSVGGREGWG